MLLVIINKLVHLMKILLYLYELTATAFKLILTNEWKAFSKSQFYCLNGVCFINVFPSTNCRYAREKCIVVVNIPFCRFSFGKFFLKQTLNSLHVETLVYKHISTLYADI